MAQEQQDNEQPLYLTSIQSATALPPRFSDISRPSDGTIQVERLRLTPAGTGHDEEDRKDDENEDDDIQPASPYPINTTISTLASIPPLPSSNRNILHAIEHIRTLNIDSEPYNNNNNNDIHNTSSPSTPFKSNKNTKKYNLAFRKSRKTTDNNKNEENKPSTSQHDRGSSLGTIHSNAGTIGTTDIREYHESMNIRPHITDKKQTKPDMAMSDKSPIMKLNEDDAASEIPPLPHSTHIKPANKPKDAGNNKSARNSNINMDASHTTAQLQDRRSIDANMNKAKESENQLKGMYLDDRDIDINNIQFDDEVDLTDDLKTRRIRRSTTNVTQESRKSVRFHDASRNTFLSPKPRRDDSMDELDTFPDIMPQNTVAPMRFRGPARIALVHKYVPMDPFEGDTEILQWSVGDVKIWISNLEGGVSIYAHNFVANHIKGQDLLHLTNEQLYHNLGVKSVGHRQIIMAAIEELKKCVIVEINVDRFLVPPNGAVMRFEDVSVQERIQNPVTKRYELQTILGHVTGTFLPNQITAIMGDTQKSLLLRVLSGCNVQSNHHVSGHIFINGNPIDGSLVNAGLASYINGDYSYSNFTRTTVSDLVKFYVKLSGDNSGNLVTNASFNELVNHVLRISDINYPQRTKISELKAVQYKRLMIAVDTILYDIKLIFLDKILDGLTSAEMVDMMQMIYSFSRRLDITFILSVERIRYHILNAYFDQIIVVGGVDAQKIVNDCTNYYKHVDLNVEEEIQVIHSMDGNDGDGDMDIYARNNANHQSVHNDLMDSATSVRFVGRPEDVMEYFRLKQVEFVHTENPIEVIFEHVMHNFELIEPELEDDYFRYRKKSKSLSPFTANTGPRIKNRLKEIFIVTQFILMVGWREWSLLYSCLRVVCYCLIVGALFWDVSCEKYFLNERLLAIFVISCIPIAAVYPLLDFHKLHRDFWFNHMLLPNRVRQSSFITALIILCCTHSVVIGLFSFLPWLMEDLGANDVIAFVRIGFMQFFTSVIYAVIALFGAEIFAANSLRIISLMCTSSVLFAGALIHAGDIHNRPGTALIAINFLKYSLEFLLYTDVDYIQMDVCADYVQSLKERQFYDREPVDITVIFVWLLLVIFLFSFTVKFALNKTLSYSSQFMIGRLSYKKQADEYELPSLPATPTHDEYNPVLPLHTYASTSLTTSLGPPTPIRAAHAMDMTPQIPVLPLNITPLSQSSHMSHATGAFTRIGSAVSGTPTTPLRLAVHARSTSDSEARFKVVSMLKQASTDSYNLTPLTPIIVNIDNNNINNNNNALPEAIPFEHPELARRRARSGNRVTPNVSTDTLHSVGSASVQQNASSVSLQTNPSASIHNLTHHPHQISLSGLERIGEKKTEEFQAVPPSTSDTLLLRQQQIASGIVPATSANVKILSTRTSMMSHPGDMNAGSRYSGISSFTPLRQQSLIGRMSFSNRRRSSVNMKSQAVPRFLAISPAQSFAATQMAFPSHKHIQTPPTEKSADKNMNPFSNKRLMASASISAVGIPFNDGYDGKEEEKVDDNRRLSTVPSQETVSIPRVSEKLVIDDFDDKDFEARMKTAPLIFYDLVVVNRYKQLIFNKISGHVIANGVSTFLAPSNIDMTPLLKTIAGIFCEELLYVEGKIIVRGRELLTEMKLAQNRIIAYVPRQPVLPDLISVQEIVRLAFILTGNGSGGGGASTDNVHTILKTMELRHVKDMRVSQLSRLDYLKVAIAYCGLRSKASIVLIENIYCELNIIEQKQLIRCIHRLSQVHELSILTTMFELTLESIQQDHINHIIVLADIYNNGVSPIYEGTIQESLQILPKLFSFKKFENVIDELLDNSCKTDTQSMQKLVLLIHDLRQANNMEMLQLQTLPMNRNMVERLPINMRNKWLEYWWLGWLYWRFVANHKQIFLVQVFKIFVYVLVVCLAFWNLPSTHSGSKSMFGAMNALLFIFVMQTPANHRLFVPLLSLGIQDWQSGKYSLNMMSTLHCWSQYLLSIVLASITALLSYWTLNFNDPATAMGYSIVLFTMGFVYSAGVWDSIYFLLFATGCNNNLSFFIMVHLLLYFWLFSGCFILKTSMPLVLRYVGYYANPVRLTLESQYCAIILPKTFANERGSDILAESGYDCAIGFDLCLVFLITFVLRIVGSLVLAYRYESIPLYNNNMMPFMNDPNNDRSDEEDDDDDDDGDDGQPANVPLVKSRVSKEENVENNNNNKKTKNLLAAPISIDVPSLENSKRYSRHKGHSSVNHIPTVSTIILSPTPTAPVHVGGNNNNNDHYINMDNVGEKAEKKSLIGGLKKFVDKKLKKNQNNGVGIIDLDDEEEEDDDDSDSELVNLENEYRAYGNNAMGDNNNNNGSRVKYGNNDNNYSTMILGTGADDSDDMLL